MATWDPDETQQRVLAQERGRLLVLGAAGTGKTTLLVELMARRHRSGRSPALALCLTRQAASDVRDRVTRASGRTSLQPQAMTLHAFCLSVLGRFSDLDAAPRLLTAPEQEFRIRELLAGGGRGRWPESLTDAVGTRSFARQVRAALARARQLGLDPADLEGFGALAGDVGWARLGAFMDEYLDILDAEGALDYAELVHRVRILVGRPEIAAAIARDAGALYVDDYSELDPAQLALVAALAEGAEHVVAFADPDAAIYRFRGAHPRAVTEFGRLFGGEVLPLRFNHRCPVDLAEPAARVAARLGAPAVGPDLVEAYRGAVPVSGPGQAEARTFPDEDAQNRFIAGELRAEHLDRGTAWADMAVLVRSGRGQIPGIARALTDAGIPVEVAGDEIGLADSLAVRPLLLALEVAARDGGCDADEAVRLLTTGWGGLDAVSIRVLGRALRAAASASGRSTSGRSSGDLIAQVLSGGDLPETSDPGASEVLAQVGQRRDALAQARAAIDAGRRPDEVLWLLWGATPWAEHLRSTALSGSDAAPRANRDLDAVIALFDLARESSAPSGAAGVRAFLAEVAAQQIPADFERESAVRGRGVRVLTAHRAKGRQWPVVVVAGVQEGIWPDVRRRGSLFDPQRLTNSGLADGVATRDLVAGERRLFLLALTRASRRLLVTAVSGVEGEANQPSRFVDELGLTVRHVLAPPPRLHTLRALVASLRATAMDAEVSPELRQAATVRLARLASEVDGHGRPLAPDADPERWWGVRTVTGVTAPRRPERLVLTPSQLQAVLACPRQYFLSREVKADPPRSSSALLGSVIHALAEHALSEGLTADNALDYLDRVWDDIPFPAPWFSQSERAAAEAAVMRFMGWQAAHDYADVLGVEVPFEADVEVDGATVTLMGSVDRLERDSSGKLRIIDFKSARALPTQAEAAASEQLGVYQLAADAGAFDELAPSTGSAGAQLVFLRHGEDDAPKVLSQDALGARPHLSDDPEELAYPTWVHHRIAQARQVLVSGRFDATPGRACRWCSFASSCPATSGQVIT